VVSEFVGSEDTTIMPYEVGFTVHRLVHLVADEFKDVSEGLLILGAFSTLSQFEVNFCEVHANCLRDESFEQLKCEVKLKSISFVSSG
jgi:hypothetical protein